MQQQQHQRSRGRKQGQQKRKAELVFDVLHRAIDIIEDSSVSTKEKEDCSVQINSSGLRFMQKIAKKGNGRGRNNNTINQDDDCNAVSNDNDALRSMINTNTSIGAQIQVQQRRQNLTKAGNDDIDNATHSTAHNSRAP